MSKRPKKLVQPWLERDPETFSMRISPQPPPAAIYLFNERGERVAWITQIAQLADSIADIQCQLIGRIEVADGWPVLRGERVPSGKPYKPKRVEGTMRSWKALLADQKKSRKRATK